MGKNMRPLDQSGSHSVLQLEFGGTMSYREQQVEKTMLRGQWIGVFRHVSRLNRDP